MKPDEQVNSEREREREKKKKRKKRRRRGERSVERKGEPKRVKQMD